MVSVVFPCFFSNDFNHDKNLASIPCHGAMELTHSNPQLVPQERGLELLTGTPFYRFLRGFQEGVFQEEVDDFVKEHASEFAVLCMDGSYPLHWNQLHKEYKELFDQQLEAILWFQDSDKDQFLETCQAIGRACDSLPEDASIPVLPGEFSGLTVGAFHHFMSALTASEDFEAFLQVMFAAASGMLQPTVLLSSPASEVSMTVLSGDAAAPVSCPLGPAVERVPQGYQAGSTFPATVYLPT
eukprot:s1611_g6.t1